MSPAKTGEKKPPATAAGDNAGEGLPMDLARTIAERESAAAPDPGGAKKAPALKSVPPPFVLVTAVRVSYTSAEEWLDELAANADLVESRIVRMFVREEPPLEGYGMSRVDVVAGYVARGQVYELVAPAGTDWHTDSEADLATRARRDELVAAIAIAADTLGLNVRGGRFGSL